MSAHQQRFELHHIGIAVRDMEAALDTLVGELGATPVVGERLAGYAFVLTRVGDAHSGMNIELLEPWDVEEDDFLQRFLDDHGEGPHHLTFLVPEIHETVAELERAEIELRRVNLAWPEWQEAFVPPCCAHGTVVQVAASRTPHPPMDELMAAAEAGVLLDDLPRTEHGRDRLWWAGRPRGQHRAFLRHIELRTRNPLGAEALFAGVLKGEPVAHGDRWTEYAWSTGSRLRVVESADEGVHHLEVDGLLEPRRIGGAALHPVRHDARQA